jgi:hypothetical protein
MNLRFFIVLAAVALVGLGQAGAWAQFVISKPDTVTPPVETNQQATPNLPDACKLLLKSDLEALFPGRPIGSKPPMLSPIHKGPQYNQACTFTVKLPSPTSKMEVTKFVSVNIIQWGGETDGRNGSAATFARMRSTREQISKNPKLNARFERIPDLGDEAFLDFSAGSYRINVRKADLIYIVSVDEYSPQSQPNAIALATQVGKRWKMGIGVIDAATPIATNNSVDIPQDTRVSSLAPADQWPDACALLTAEDVRAVFSDMKIDAPRKVIGQIKHESRIDRVEDLPKPIRCLYPTSRTELVNGERQVVVHDVALNVTNMAATPELSKKYYQVARKVGDAKTELAGLGDEASMSIMNAIYIRKGLLTIEVRVGGGARDRAIHDDATRRVQEIAKRAAANMP